MPPRPAARVAGVACELQQIQQRRFKLRVVRYSDEGFVWFDAVLCPSIQGKMISPRRDLIALDNEGAVLGLGEIEEARGLPHQRMQDGQVNGFRVLGGGFLLEGDGKSGCAPFSHFSHSRAIGSMDRGNRL